MRFFSRLVFIMNVCFIIAVVMRLVEMGKKAKNVADGLVGFQPLQSTIAVLGYLAIFVNIIFFIFFIVRYPRKRMEGLSRFVIFFNVIMLPAQIYYFFFSNL